MNLSISTPPPDVPYWSAIISPCGESTPCIAMGNACVNPYGDSTPCILVALWGFLELLGQWSTYLLDTAVHQ